jgi:hypothetical protein
MRGACDPTTRDNPSLNAGAVMADASLIAIIDHLPQRIAA